MPNRRSTPTGPRIPGLPGDYLALLSTDMLGVRRATCLAWRRIAEETSDHGLLDIVEIALDAIKIEDTARRAVQAARPRDP